MRYVKGDATAPQAPGVKLIVHSCNTLGGWGRGFVKALDKRFGRELGKAYRAWHKQRAHNDFELGAVQTLATRTNGVFVCNCIAQKGLGGKRRGNGEKTRPFSLDAFRSCLEKVRVVATEKNASVHMPRVGAGLGGGDWALTENVIVQELCDHDIEVWVYSL